MLMILIAIILTVVVSVILIKYGNEGYSAFHLFAAFIGVILAFVAGIISVVYVVAGVEWIAAEHKVKIINQEYNTSYTQEEIFWASDVIDTIRNIDRKRVELNGDIMRKVGE